MGWLQNFGQICGVETNPFKIVFQDCLLLRTVKMRLSKTFGFCKNGDFRGPDIRGGEESTQLFALMSLLREVTVTDSLDRWRCNLGPSGFHIQISATKN